MHYYDGDHDDHTSVVESEDPSQLGHHLHLDVEAASPDPLAAMSERDIILYLDSRRKEEEGGSKHCVNPLQHDHKDMAPMPGMPGGVVSGEEQQRQVSYIYVSPHTSPRDHLQSGTACALLGWAKVSSR